MMAPEREISIALTEKEWSAVINELDVEGQKLSPTACAAVLSAAPHPGGIARSFSCPVAAARELLLWCETGTARRIADNPEDAAVLRRAARNIRFALRRGLPGSQAPLGPHGHRTEG
jgi:hypothetical protein